MDASQGGPCENGPDKECAHGPNENGPKEEYVCARGGQHGAEEEYTRAPEENGMDLRSSTRARP